MEIKLDVWRLPSPIIGTRDIEGFSISNGGGDCSLAQSYCLVVQGELP